jgi:hypothetical protein
MMGRMGVTRTSSRVPISRSSESPIAVTTVVVMTSSMVITPGIMKGAVARLPFQRAWGTARMVRGGVAPAWAKRSRISASAASPK